MTEYLLFGMPRRHGKALIQDIIQSIMSYNASVIEGKLLELMNTGCECGNKNPEEFTLIYCENEFKHILCEKCKKHHHVEGILTKDMIYEKLNCTTETPTI